MIVKLITAVAVSFQLHGMVKSIGMHDYCLIGLENRQYINVKAADVMPGDIVNVTISQDNVIVTKDDSFDWSAEIGLKPLWREYAAPSDTAIKRFNTLLNGKRK